MADAPGMQAGRSAAPAIPLLQEPPMPWNITTSTSTMLMPSAAGTASAPVDTHRLNAMLLGELAAVESYTQTLASLTDDRHAGQLRQCLQSHRARAQKLRSSILRLGGGRGPDRSPGVTSSPCVPAGPGWSI